jgi:hypothetical protein
VHQTTQPPHASILPRVARRVLLRPIGGRAPLAQP